MNGKIKAINIMPAIKALLLVSLATLAFQTTNANAMYVGSPAKVDMIWVPGHCVNGCWQKGYYIQFREPICPRDLIWVKGQYDRCGNYVPGHWFYRPWYHHNHYRIIKPSCC